MICWCNMSICYAKQCARYGSEGRFIASRTGHIRVSPAVSSGDSIRVIEPEPALMWIGWQGKEDKEIADITALIDQAGCPIPKIREKEGCHSKKYLCREQFSD